MSMLETFDAVTETGLKYAVPLWLAGLGELVVQRSGVINIGIEGMMLTGAFVGWAVTVVTGSPWLGAAAAIGAGGLMAGVFAIVTLVFDADQIVAGTGLNLLAVGATGVGYQHAIDAGLMQQQASFFQPIDLHFLPFDALNQFALFYIVLILAVLLHLTLRRTRWGIELVALGEYPTAAGAAGIRVNGRRIVCVLFGGATAGLAGCYLSAMVNEQFGEHITAGRGFLALAMVVFGRWAPFGLILGGLFFGYVYAGANRLEVSPVSWMPPSQLLQAAPYVLTLVVLAGLLGKARAPAELGKPYRPD